MGSSFDAALAAPPSDFAAFASDSILIFAGLVAMVATAKPLKRIGRDDTTNRVLVSVEELHQKLQPEELFRRQVNDR
jgi:hypothetical protein